jgi:hypothetical protein
MKMLPRIYIFCCIVPAIAIFLGQPTKLRGQTLERSYGSVFLRSAEMHNQYQPILGGMGGIVFSNRLGIGAYGNGMLGSISFTGSDLKGSPETALRLQYGYGGLFAEYFFIDHPRIRLSLPVKLGYGAVGIYEDKEDERIEKSRLLVLEPEIHLDIRLSKHVALSLQSSYRIGDVKGLVNVTDQAISGIHFGIGLKMTSS